MRVLRQLLFRLRAFSGPGAIELDVMDRQISREEDSVQRCTEEAGDIERSLERSRRLLRSALTDPRSPGIVDAREARALARSLMGTSVTAATHRQHLEGLV
jgi:hypothetical protein